MFTTMAEFFPSAWASADAKLQIFVIEFVITHAQRVARLARIDGIGTVAKA